MFENFLFVDLCSAHPQTSLYSRDSENQRSAIFDHLRPSTSDLARLIDAVVGNVVVYVLLIMSGRH